MTSIKVVTLLKSGPNWLPEYVYRLRRNVERYLTVPHEFVCLSDIELDVETLPLLGCDEIDSTRIPKFWYKTQLFRPELELTQGCLFLDLDTIVKNNIDHWFEQFVKHSFLMASSPYRGEISCSYAMWWQGDHSYIWNKFQEQSVTQWNEYYHKARPEKYGDQGFISDHVEHEIIQHVLGKNHGIVRITKNASTDLSYMLVFAGKRKPWDMEWHPDVQRYWL